jgi:hypothetical protein
MRHEPDVRRPLIGSEENVGPDRERTRTEQRCGIRRVLVGVHADPTDIHSERLRDRLGDPHLQSLADATAWQRSYGRGRE